MPLVVTLYAALLADDFLTELALNSTADLSNGKRMHAAGHYLSTELHYCSFMLDPWAIAMLL